MASTDEDNTSFHSFESDYEIKSQKRAISFHEDRTISKETDKAVKDVKEDIVTDKYSNTEYKGTNTEEQLNASNISVTEYLSKEETTLEKNSITLESETDISGGNEKFYCKK